MEHLEKKLIQATSGEKRFNPDEQRLYLGTFSERVVLSIELVDCRLEAVQTGFTNILEDLKSDYPHLFVKISSKLPVSVQMPYLKAGDKLQIKTTIINESLADSPYGVIIHSDQAENLKEVSLADRYPDLLTDKQDASKKTSKKSFWTKLFGQQ